MIGAVDDAFVDAATHHDAAIVEIGNGKIRSTIQRQLQKVAPALIHSFVVASPSARLGHGTVITSNAVVSADTVIGDGLTNCILAPEAGK